MNAPIDDTPDTEEELIAIEEVRRAGFRSSRTTAPRPLGFAWPRTPPG
jgi:hypothetical protein